jgi:hypothetical protein
MDNQQFQELLKTIENATARDWFDYLTGIGSLLISIIAVIIGIKISNKLSLKRSVLERQLDTVFSLIQFLQHTRLHLAVSLEGGGYTGYHLSILEVLRDKSRDEIIEARKKKIPMIFSWSGYDDFNSLKTFKFNPYLPKIILPHLDNFEIWNPDKTPINDVTEKATSLGPMVIHTTNIKDNKNDFERDFFSNLKKTEAPLYKDFDSFVTICGGLVDEVENWLRQYEASDINLFPKSKHSYF